MSEIKSNLLVNMCFMLYRAPNLVDSPTRVEDDGDNSQSDSDSSVLTGDESVTCKTLSEDEASEEIDVAQDAWNTALLNKKKTVSMILEEKPEDVSIGDDDDF